MSADDIDELIRTAQRGEIGPLVEYMRGKPMSPTGFEKDKYGLSFGDGYMEEGSWLAVESAVMERRLSEATYNRVKAAVYERSHTN